MFQSETQHAGIHVVLAERSRLIKARPETAWALATRPCSIVEWNSRVAGCDQGRDHMGRLTRRYVLASEPDAEPVVIDEVELYRSDLTMTMTYTAELTLLPITAYSAQFLVTPEDGAARVTSRSRFLSPRGAAVAAMVEDFFQQGLDGLARLLET